MAKKQRPSSARWLKEHHSDPFVQRARKEGYRSRAAYKLLELQECLKVSGRVVPLISSGARVVELGAAPGGWTQVVTRLIGEQGRIVGIDLLEMDPIPGATLLQGDFLEEEAVTAIEAEMPGGEIDVVLSDMAPNMCGIKSADQTRGELLAELALQFAEENLKVGGNLAIKLFNGPGFHDMVKQARAQFDHCKVIKPDASRSRSPEHYLVGFGYKGA
uniref:Ribosomal RNA large subunit methyltransferase E n=1 Tax=Magnetococcus massalia (strain MO-1) TaxID=451514 RepID=A0A1S7LLI5_MAGMO|nr:Ribosomal RNA large subunit methyltransferase J [Candidatus Magnetococcus massalia]